MNTQALRRQSIRIGIIALVAFLSFALPASGATLHVSAQANLFGAGHTTLPGGSGKGVRPPLIRFPATSGKAVTFTSVTGRVGCAGSLTNGPDGSCFTGGTNISSLGGIAGMIDAQRTMVLAGLFLTSSEPADPAPARLDFSDTVVGHDFTSLSPKVGQTFFIGNGKTAGGGAQRFNIPATATRFFLGIVDASAFHSSPGTYQDNVGSFTATFSTTSGSSEPPPPVAGKSVIADVVSGTVFISVPTGKSIRRGKGKKSVVATTSRFRRYRGKANIPVGSIIDTRRGRIGITAAADLKGGTHAGDFYDGIFQIKQLRSAHPTTDAELVNSRSACSSRAARSSAKKRVLGRLWATGKGRFRTKGRYSSAAVRGTTWLTEDRCDGTLTKVSRGTVSVLDKVKHKTVILTAGQSYFARAQRASTKG